MGELRRRLTSNRPHHINLYLTEALVASPKVRPDSPRYRKQEPRRKRERYKTRGGVTLNGSAS